MKGRGRTDGDARCWLIRPAAGMDAERGRRGGRRQTGRRRSAHTRRCFDGLEISYDNGDKARVAFALDCCDREAMEHVATGGIAAKDAQDLAVATVARVEHRQNSRSTRTIVAFWRAHARPSLVADRCRYPAWVHCSPALSSPRFLTPRSSARAATWLAGSARCHGRTRAAERSGWAAITNAGQQYQRQMLIVGAMAVVRYAERNGTKRPWLVQLLARQKAKVADCARQ